MPRIFAESQYDDGLPALTPSQRAMRADEGLIELPRHRSHQDDDGEYYFKLLRRRSHRDDDGDLPLTPSQLQAALTA